MNYQSRLSYSNLYFCWSYDITSYNNHLPASSNVTLCFLLTMALLNLPPELLIQILSELPSNDIIFSGLLVNRSLHYLIRNSSLLQYHIEAKHAGVEDNPQSTMANAERLEALRRSEYAWSHFAVGKRINLPVRYRSSGLYDLTAGIYVLGELGDASSPYPTP